MRLYFPNNIVIPLHFSIKWIFSVGKRRKFSLSTPYQHIKNFPVISWLLTIRIFAYFAGMRNYPPDSIIHQYFWRFIFLNEVLEFKLNIGMPCRRLSAQICYAIFSGKSNNYFFSSWHTNFSPQKNWKQQGIFPISILSRTGGAKSSHSWFVKIFQCVLQ